MGTMSLQLRRAGLLAIAALALTGCSDGDDGNDGAPGEQGPPGPATPVDAGDATEIEATIDGVTIASQPVVNFRLADGSGAPVVGLQDGSISFYIAKLTPGTNGNASAWQSYINRVESAGAGPWPGTEDQVQATSENVNGTYGTLDDNGDGSYQYTFATDVANVPGVPYDPDLTHRVSFEIRGLVPVLNPTYDFQPSSGATTNLFTRKIVKDATCNVCHDQLALHGNGRFTVDNCMTCHNPGSTDAQSTNTVDMKVMTHKIHFGAELPSVQAGGEYAIWGFRNVKHDYSGVIYPGDILDCRGCHDEGDQETPDAANWFNVPTMEACGSCHDDVNFETGENHATGISATNNECTICHGGDSQLRADRVHVNAAREAAKAFQYNIIDIVDTGAGESPTVSFSVTDPTNGDAPYDILNDEPFTSGQSSLAINISWDTLALNNLGSDSGSASGAPAQPIEIDLLDGSSSDPDGDLVFEATAADAIPLLTEGSGIVAMEGHPAVDLDGDGDNEDRGDRVPATGASDTFAITDGTPQDRAAIVTIEQCNACHVPLSLHGNNRTDNIELCLTCHTSDTTDIRRRGQAGCDSDTCIDGKDEETVEFKTMIHAIHAGEERTNGYVAYAFGGRAADFGEVVFPGNLANCENCHRPGTYYPVGVSALAATIDTGADIDSPFDDLNITPNSAACWGCHDRPEAVSHMTLNGGAFDAIQQPDGTLISQSAGTVIEACDVCHGEGRIADVGEIHAH
ncbi:MAG: OmcA/MtrC family decaheme c-type cytochrome [Chromatiales bacterium]|nr:MAG: OmcA/MtrC family decaheme c-type cytochrome [Chromatiales bacterium]